MPMVRLIAVRRAARLDAIVDWLVANPTRRVLRLIAIETLFSQSPPCLSSAPCNDTHDSSFQNAIENDPPDSLLCYAWRVLIMDAVAVACPRHARIKKPPDLSG